MTTVVHNGQALVKINRHKKHEENTMDLDTTIADLETQLQQAKAKKKASGEIAKTAKEWIREGVEIEVILQGLKDAGYTMAASKGKASKGNGAAPMPLDVAKKALGALKGGKGNAKAIAEQAGEGYGSRNFTATRQAHPSAFIIAGGRGAGAIYKLAE